MSFILFWRICVIYSRFFLHLNFHNINRSVRSLEITVSPFSILRNPSPIWDPTW